MVLAIESGVSPSQWWREDDRTIWTALDVLAREREQQAKAARKRAAGRAGTDDEGRVMGGGG